MVTDLRAASAQGNVSMSPTISAAAGHPLTLDGDGDDDGDDGDDDDDLYIMVKCVCVCLSRKSDQICLTPPPFQFFCPNFF